MQWGEAIVWKRGASIAVSVHIIVFGSNCLAFRYCASGLLIFPQKGFIKSLRGGVVKQKANIAVAGKRGATIAVPAHGIVFGSKCLSSRYRASGPLIFSQKGVIKGIKEEVVVGKRRGIKLATNNCWKCSWGVEINQVNQNYDRTASSKICHDVEQQQVDSFASQASKGLHAHRAEPEAGNPDHSGLEEKSEHTNE